MIKEIFKTALCWTMGIIMFLVIFVYDSKRVDLTLELEKKIETVCQENAILNLHNYVDEKDNVLEKQMDWSNNEILKQQNWIEIHRAQLSQLKPFRQK